MSYTFHMTHARLRNRGWPPNVLRESFVVKLSLRQLGFRENPFLHCLLYLVPSCKRCPLQTQTLVLGPLLDSDAMFFCFFMQNYSHACLFATFETVYQHARATHANSKPCFVSTENKNAIFLPHIAPVLNHRSHLPPRPFCTLWISKPPTSSERSAPSNPSQSARRERKQAHFLFRHRWNVLVNNLLLIPDHTRDL